LVKKTCLADGIQPYVAMAFGPVTRSFDQAWIGALAYTFQLYFDFSGYSDMAIGISLMFGIFLPLNFNSPYEATRRGSAQKKTNGKDFCPIGRTLTGSRINPQRGHKA
jgi:D-alanyl-lipoteichoic acid acyltransferase DltB (MBOAT superfamily)